MIRVANCSGFYGDRLAAAAEQVRGGAIDVLTGDYLAELTMALLLRDQMKDPSAGFAKTFLAQLADVLAPCLERGVPIVVNAGGLNPRGLAAAVRQLAGDSGLSPVVAWVEGDAVADRLGPWQAAGNPLAHLDSGVPLCDAPGPALAANAYLGCWPIVEALRGGAQIVVTGRCTDAAVVMGPAAWRHGWERSDYGPLGGALVAAHVIECGCQATGGNFAFWKELSLDHPGFPIAEIEADGSSVITKHAGTDGAVTVETVKAQLLYEVQGRVYISPDTVVDLQSVKLSQQGPDRVHIAPVEAGPPPSTLKTGVLVTAGFRNQVKVLLSPPDAREKAEHVASAFWKRLGGQERFDDARTDLIGGDSVSDDAQESLAVLLLTARSLDRRRVGRGFTAAAVEQALCSIPGMTMLDPPGAPRPCVAFWPVLVERCEVPMRVHVGDETRDVAHPGDASPRTVWPHAELPLESPADGEQVGVPLARLVGARSGDKGGNANVGLWVRSEGHYAWLARVVTLERMRSWLEKSGFSGEITRTELPNLGAVNFILHGWLGLGVGASVLPDGQAKTLAEFVRTRTIDVPAAWLASS